MISNAIRLLELTSKKEDNCNIMRSHDWSRDRSNLIGTISYHNLSQSGLLINHLLPDLPNLLGQSSKSTFQINLLNQSTQSTFSLTSQYH